MKGDWEKEDVGAGFTGKGTDGKSYSNGCGTEVTRAIFRNNEANVEVIAGSESAVTLVRNE